MAESNHWQLIPLEDFERPSAPASTLVQKALIRLHSLVGSSAHEESTPEEQDFPHYREFDVAPAIAAVESAWEALDHTPTVGFVVSPPFSGSGAILREWANNYGYQHLEPPDIHQLESANTDT